MKILLTVLLFLSLISGVQAQRTPKVDSTEFIQICLLLDVSGSMEGLLTRAQTQIWKLLTYVEKFELKKKRPRIQMAILSYGNALYAAVIIILPSLRDCVTSVNKRFTSDK